MKLRLTLHKVFDFDTDDFDAEALKEKLSDLAGEPTEPKDVNFVDMHEAICDLLSEDFDGIIDLSEIDEHDVEINEVKE